MFWVRSDLDSGKEIRVFNFVGVSWVRSDLGVFNFGGLGGGGCSG